MVPNFSSSMLVTQHHSALQALPASFPAFPTASFETLYKQYATETDTRQRWRRESLRPTARLSTFFHAGVTEDGPEFTPDRSTKLWPVEPASRLDIASAGALQSGSLFHTGLFSSGEN